MAEMETEAARITELRDDFGVRLEAGLDDIVINGHSTSRLPGNLNVSFKGVDAETLMMSLPDVAMSSGSACTSASLETSHVLSAIGVSDALAHGTIRFGFGVSMMRAKL